MFFVLREPWGGICFELEDGFGVCEGAVGYLVPGFMMAVLVGGFGYVDHITLNVTDIEAATEAFKKLGMTVDGSLDADGW